MLVKWVSPWKGPRGAIQLENKLVSVSRSFPRSPSYTVEKVPCSCYPWRWAGVDPWCELNWQGHTSKSTSWGYKKKSFSLLMVSDFWPLTPQFGSGQSLSSVRLFATPWIIAHQASLSITNSRSSLKLTSIESLMPSSHLILCYPLFLLPPIPPSIRVFSNESTLHMRWPKYWSFSFSISPSREMPGLIRC